MTSNLSENNKPLQRHISKNNKAIILKRMRTLSLWIFAVAFSIFLNMALFDFMPCLIDQNPGRLKHSKFFERMNVIRIKKPESRIRRKKKKHKIKLKKYINMLTKKQVYTNPGTKITRQIDNIPFEINSKLPAIEGTLKVAPMKMISLNLPGLKNSYGIGEIDHPLTPIVQLPPVYPMRARRMGIEGWVKVRFIVDEDGRVTKIKILDSRPGKIFNNSVLHCVSAWRFKPGTIEGEPVKTQVETIIRFKME